VSILIHSENLGLHQDDIGIIILCGSITVPSRNTIDLSDPGFFLKFLNFFLRIMIGRDSVIWLTEKPDEPSVFICNHTRTYAPLTMELNFDRKVRPWVNGYMLTYRNTVKLMYNKIAYDFRPKLLRRLLLIVLSPFINIYFRSLEPIPVFHDTRIRLAFSKTNETLMSGKDIVIYPEKNVIPPNKYINELEVGFVHLARHYYQKTGKCVRFYPVYCCKDLKIIMVGEPITYNPEKDFKRHREEIVTYLTEKIEELGNSLPEHKVYMNKVYPPEINNFHF